MSQSLAQQLEAIACGDTQAMAAFYEQWFDWTLAQIRTQTRKDESFCLDVVQEVMLKVIRRTPQCQTDDQLRTWLHRVTLTTAYDLLRSESRRALRQRRASVPEESIKARGRIESEDAEHLAWLRKQIAALDPASVWLLEARHRFGWTLARIGAALGAKPGAIDRKLRTIRSELAAKAQEVFDD